MFRCEHNFETYSLDGGIPLQIEKEIVTRRVSAALSGVDSGGGGDGRAQQGGMAGLGLELRKEPKGYSRIVAVHPMVHPVDHVQASADCVPAVPILEPSRI